MSTKQGQLLFLMSLTLAQILAASMPTATATVLVVTANNQSMILPPPSLPNLITLTNQTDTSPLPFCCQPWTFYDKKSSRCQCGDTIHRIVDHCTEPTTISSEPCNNNNSVNTTDKHYFRKGTVLGCYCMSYLEELDVTLLGGCLYTCHKLYHDMPDTVWNLDNSTCGPFSRTGQMCGSCKEGYAPPVYSYSLACVECSDYKYNWLKYIAVAYLPLTLFYFIVVFFRVNVTRPPLNIYMFLCQAIAIPPIIQLLNQTKVTIHEVKLNDDIITAVFKDTLISLYGLWNLDIFRVLYRPFCLHPNMTTLQALTLDYVIAVYPLCLIVLTYILVKLHDNYSLVVRLWTPFRRCFSYFRKEWDLSNSIIGAFTTFLLLSYTKNLYVSFSLLLPNVFYVVNGSMWNETYLFYDSTVVWFGRDHIYYGILAIVMFSCFNLLPLVLICIYPCTCTHVIMNRLRIRRQLLNNFMEAFHGHYKYSPRKYGWFAGVYLALRMTILVIIGIVLNYLFILALVPILFTGCTLLLLILKPYKNNTFNIVDAIFLTFLSLGCISYAFQQGSTFGTNMPAMKIITWVTSFLIILPPVCGLGLLTFRMVPQKILNKLKALFRCVRRCFKREEEEERIPHRLLFPNDKEYQPLIPK